MSITSSFSFRIGESTPIDMQVVPLADITSWTLAFTAILSGGPGSAAPSIQYTSAPGIAVTDGPTGMLRVTIATADTASLAPGVYVWEVRRVDAGFNQVAAEGTFFLLPSPTYIQPQQQAGGCRQWQTGWWQTGGSWPAGECPPWFEGYHYGL
jgi:hypothetical protein